MAATEAIVDERDSDPIPLSALQHAVYCLRQAALIHLERVWAENRFTAEGQIVHATANLPANLRTRGVRRVTALVLASRRLGIGGVADLVEFRKTSEGERPFPVEFKRGKPKLHRADEVQLCAQALCLEEMFDCLVPEGALYYAETKRRVAVPLDVELRAITEETIGRLREVFSSATTPPPIWRAERCRACSLVELCRPRAMAQPVSQWRRHMVNLMLSEEMS
ncbi:MAG: CRISPR-associated protein Cas4 [Rhizomicrobium sp.]|nr:CRISPR-associated protein Cas4 [Rhizomicrobium sp.]